MRILIADDDPTSRLLLKTALTRRGHDVASVGDGLEALKILQSDNPPPLVILDWMMPGLDGPDVCRRIRESKNLRYVYIILLTSKTEKRDVILGIDSGADVFLSKPVELDELKSRIAAAERILSFRPRGMGDEKTAIKAPPLDESQSPSPQLDLEVPERLLPLSNEILFDPVLVAAPRVRVKSKFYPVLGKMVLLEQVGQGGMGAVYRAYNPRTRVNVAVKVVSTALFRDDLGMTERFYREAQIASMVHSPHLVSVFDIDQEMSLLYLVMEFVDGMAATNCLIRAIKDGKPGLSERVALQICIAAAKGLAAAHENGIVHRDVKPENVLVPYAPERTKLDYCASKLADLGIAKHELNTEGLTRTNMALGTVGFMAPEQIQDPRNVGKPADVFGFGVMFFLLLCGRLPFVSDSPFDVFVDTINRPHPPVKIFRPDVSSTISSIIDTCLVKEPSRRYPDAGALLTDLEYALREQELTAAEPA